MGLKSVKIERLKKISICIRKHLPLGSCVGSQRHCQDFLQKMVLGD